MTDFLLTEPGRFSDLLRERGCPTFAHACDWVKNLPYGRTSNREDLSLVFTENKGTCSSKHAILAFAALEQHHPEVEIIAGVFMMNGETHPVLEDFFIGKPYKSLPECHCYLRVNGERFDFTSPADLMGDIAPKIVREQRMDPHQSIEWKVNIHKNYIEGWLRRNKELDLTFAEIWSDREACISILSKN